MKNPKTTSVLAGLGLMLVLAYGYAQGNHWPSTSINTFINNTGQAVGGLHIQFQYNFGGSGSAWLLVYQNPANTFADVQTDSSGQVNLSSGTVAAGGSVQISVINRNYAPIRNITWWWTDVSGNLVGKIHNGCTNPNCTSP